MAPRALTIEQKRANQRRRNEKYISDPEKLQRKREIDRLRKQERRRREQITLLDPLALLADAAMQREILPPSEEVVEGELESSIYSDRSPEPEPLNQDNGMFVQEDGLIMQGFEGDNWHDEGVEQGMTIDVRHQAHK